MDGENQVADKKMETSEKRTRSKRRYDRQYLINKLNYTNFQDRTISVNFIHIKYNRTITRMANPQPCLGNELQCLWLEEETVPADLKSYRLQNIILFDGQKLLMANAALIRMDEKGIVFDLPESCYEITPRKARRYLSERIQVQLIQNGAVFHGVLKDFSSISFRIELTTAPTQSFQWINPETSATVVLHKNDQIFYTGDCNLLRQSFDQNSRTYVLELLNHRILRFPSKEFRSTRQTLVPSPNAIFKHPLTDKTINLKVADLSGTGLSVEEDLNNSVLIAGLIIPELELRFADNFKAKCMVQVVYRKSIDPHEQEGTVKCGLAILDMNSEDHVRILSLLQQAKDSHSYISTKVDMDQLWNFFFETGFIYPKKYAYIQANKEKVKSTYEKLYTMNPKIARHFIFQDKGAILGHMAMLRFYENSWLIHHHAANKKDSTRAGLAVLNQIGRFINDSHRLPSIHMDYVYCYYRPDNRFPNRVFGGAFKRIENLKGCSVDPFAYFHYQHDGLQERELPVNWTVSATQIEDLVELEGYYEFSSGGLMINALDLEPTGGMEGTLEDTYAELGFKRKRQLLSVKEAGELKAVFILNLSDIGLNMSDLTNCVKAIVLDPDGFSLKNLEQVLGRLSRHFEEDTPVLLYPLDYAETHSLAYEKTYNLWILNLQNTDDYFRYLNRLLRVIDH